MKNQFEALYIFACGTLMLREQDLNAAGEVAKALDSPDACVRGVAGYFMNAASQMFAPAHA